MEGKDSFFSLESARDRGLAIKAGHTRVPHGSEKSSSKGEGGSSGHPEGKGGGGQELRRGRWTEISHFPTSLRSKGDN